MQKVGKSAPLSLATYIKSIVQMMIVRTHMKRKMSRRKLWMCQSHAKSLWVLLPTLARFNERDLMFFLFALNNCACVYCRLAKHLWRDAACRNLELLYQTDWPRALHSGLCAGHVWLHQPFRWLLCLQHTLWVLSTVFPCRRGASQLEDFWVLW